MRSLTVRLPDGLVAEIEEESQGRGVSKSDVVRDRLTHSGSSAVSSRFGAIADLIGSVEGLPSDLSARKKAYLRATGYGRKRSR
jgi:hypothetical protein